MHPRNRAIRFAIGALLLGCATPATAQEGVDWGGLMAGIAHGTAMDEAAQESVSENRPAAEARAPASTLRLTYKPSLDRRRANFARFIAKAHAQDPQGAASLEKELGASDLIARAEPELAQYGLRIDNVADAYAICWLNAWLAIRQRTDTPPARQITAVRQGARASGLDLGAINLTDKGFVPR